MLCPWTPRPSSWAPLLLWLLFLHRLSLGAPCGLATWSRDSVQELGVRLDTAAWIQVTKAGTVGTERAGERKH